MERIKLKIRLFAIGKLLLIIAVPFYLFTIPLFYSFFKVATFGQTFEKKYIQIDSSVMVSDEGARNLFSLYSKDLNYKQIELISENRYLPIREDEMYWVWDNDNFNSAFLAYEHEKEFPRYIFTNRLLAYVSGFIFLLLWGIIIPKYLKIDL